MESTKHNPAEFERELAEVKRELADLKEDYIEFASIIVHDLSATMREIEGFSDIILEENTDSFDERTRKRFKHIIHGVGEAKKILAALLEYSSLNTDVTSFSKCDCNKVFNTIREELMPLIKKTGASIQCDNLPIVLADTHQITHLFRHLLHNALMYQKGDVHPDIYISCETHEEYWTFSIKDNGIGIRDKLTEKIFKILRRAVSNKTYSGMGMGLAIAKKIIQRHSGRIWLESIPNEGTIFYFTLANKTSETKS